MPIECAATIYPTTRNEFYQTDKQVLGIAYSIHNKFGRFLNEKMYQEEIAWRCRQEGLDCLREMRIRISHDNFIRDYFVDLMINRCIVFETKTVESLHKVHDAQVMNYLFLTNTQHGSLINLRPLSVTRRFISTTLSLADRREFEAIDINWNAPCPEFKLLRERMIELVRDWGMFLDFKLYRDAMTHFLGGADHVIKNLPVYSNTRELGTQDVRLLTPNFAFTFSAIKGDRKGMLEHQDRFLQHTKLQGIAWVNLNGHQIEFTTIQK